MADINENNSETRHGYDPYNGTEYWRTTVQIDGGSLEICTDYMQVFLDLPHSGEWETAVFKHDEDGHRVYIDVARSLGGESINDPEHASAMHNAMVEKWENYDGSYDSLTDIDDWDTETFQKVGLDEPVTVETKGEYTQSEISGFIERAFADNYYYPDRLYAKVDVMLESVGYYKEGDRTPFAEALDKSPAFTEFKELLQNYIDADKNEQSTREEYLEKEDQIHKDADNGKISSFEESALTSDVRESWENARSDRGYAGHMLKTFVESLDNLKDQVDEREDADVASDKNTGAEEQNNHDYIDEHANVVDEANDEDKTDQEEGEKETTVSYSDIIDLVNAIMDGVSSVIESEISNFVEKFDNDSSNEQGKDVENNDSASASVDDETNKDGADTGDSDEIEDDWNDWDSGDSVD